MKKYFGAFLILFITAQGLWAQFYKELPPAKRKELAESYYLVGNRYGEQGENNKASAFHEMAYNINPYLKPEEIKTQELPAAAAMILKGEARLLSEKAERADAVDELIRSKFIRLVSAFLTKDIDSLLTLIDGSLYLTKSGIEITQEEIRKELEPFFKTVALGGLVPSQVYDLNSLNVERISPALAGNWGETYALNIKANVDFSEYIGFWEDRQQFLIHHSCSKWTIFSIGKSLPPSDWAPEPAPELTEKRVSAVLQGSGKEIKEVFLSCLDSFLEKNVQEASEHFSNNIHLLRLNTTLSRKEIASTFEGYFDNCEFTGIKPDDVLETDSIFIQESDKFAELKTPQVFLLTVKTRLDLSDQLPFWTRFQDYYFFEEDGSWKIFAIF